MNLGMVEKAIVRRTTSLCVLRVGEEKFGIETDRVDQVLGESTLNRVPLASSFVGGMIPYRGEVLLVISLRAVLGLPANEGLESVVVLRETGTEERFGLAADDVAEVILVDEESFEANPCTLDASRCALSDGAYKVRDELVVKLEHERLLPSVLLHRWERERNG